MGRPKKIKETEEVSENEISSETIDGKDYHIVRNKNGEIISKGEV